MDVQISAAFSRLQPLCVRLAKEHTRDNVTMVMRELETIECKEVMQQLQEYVLFPLRLILKQPEKRYNVCTLFSIKMSVHMKRLRLCQHVEAILFVCATIDTKSNINKKVLLRERKRHTARRVASTCLEVVPPPPHLEVVPPQLKVVTPPPSWR